MKRIIIITGLTFFMLFDSFAQTDSIVSDSLPIVKVAYGELDADRVVGAIDIIDGELLSKTSNYTTSQAIKGLAAGLYGVNKVRGNSRGGINDDALIIVDGIANRSYNYISPDEIESVQILKDATAKMLYGSKAANGVIVVTTKRGKVQDATINFSAEHGLKTPTIVPEYLSSAQYTALYRQAEINDGKSVLTYSEDDIAKYADPNASRILYPDVDYNDAFLSSFKNFSRINGQLVGGNERTQYFVNLAYTREGGIVAVGDNHVRDRFNIRSNLDYQVNDIISMNLDIATRLSYSDIPFTSEAEVFSMIADHRPNDYPLFVSQQADADSLGYGRGRVDKNLYGELIRKGYKNSKDYYNENSLGINFNLESLLEGLSASAKVSFDASTSMEIGKELSYSRYQVGNALNPDTLIQYGVDDLSGVQKKFSDDFIRNWGGIGSVNYANEFGLHAIQADMVYTIQSYATKLQTSGATVSQDDKSINLGLRANYMYDDRYVLQVSSSMMGSDKFTPENRWGLYGAAGGAWIVSNESFLENSGFIDYLKLKASYGIMGYDHGYDYYVYRDEYGTSTFYDLGHSNSLRIFGTTVVRLGNPDYTFEEAKELNIGTEAAFLRNRLGLEANYFNEKRVGMPTQSPSFLPDYVIGGIGIPLVNTNAVHNEGVDLSILYTDVAGDFSYAFGGNLLYSKAVYDIYDELYEYEHLRMQGKETDALFGLIADGLYADAADITSHNAISTYGTVLPGDIKYTNTTNDRGDNVIDTYDRQMIGNADPRLNYAVNINLAYNGLELYVIGQGRAGYDRMRSVYYQNFAAKKYTDFALGAAEPNDPASIAAATHPRLTTFSGSSAHSYRNSTYWIVDGGYFKLRTVELAYNLPSNLAGRIYTKAAKVYVRGNDLFTISDTPEIDPEYPNAGILTAPLYRTVTMGLKLTF